jgi:hypothetical protein
MLWTLFAVLLVLWLLGLVAHVGGALINLLLLVALVVLTVNVLARGRSKV